MSVCKKLRYATPEAADKVLLESNMRRALHGSNRRREIRKYRCGTCRGWHLSSQPGGNTPATAADERGAV